jgi:hypothetical protein
VLTRLDRRQGIGGSKLRAAGVWEQGSVYKILTNMSYTGTAYYGKWEPVTRTARRLRPQEEWIAIPVPVIITPQLFEAVQARLRQRKRLARRNRKQEYLLIGGRLRYGRCGRTMSGYTGHDRLRYRCASAYVMNPDGGKCRGQIHADDAEAQVWRAVEEVLQQPEIIAAEVQRHHANGERNQQGLPLEGGECIEVDRGGRDDKVLEVGGAQGTQVRQETMPKANSGRLKPLAIAKTRTRRAKLASQRQASTNGQPPSSAQNGTKGPLRLPKADTPHKPRACKKRGGFILVYSPRTHHRSYPFSSAQKSVSAQRVGPRSSPSSPRRRHPQPPRLLDSPP